MRIIVQTEQFGPAEPFFPSLSPSIEEMTVAAKGAVLVSGKETTEYDPYDQSSDTQTA